jgi:hypothetical protein
VTRSRNNRTGRNDLCPCGSGQKFKRCHGALEDTPAQPRGPSDELIRAQLAKHRADELRRESMQGRGKRIISTKFQGHQFVGVGSTLIWGKWKTFFEFLDNYLSARFDKVWGDAELKKPIGERHPILCWYETKTRYMNDKIVEPGKIHTAPMTGAAAAYYMLAYSLYLLEHNAELQKRLIGRLKNRDQFHGAYYEAFVAGVCILAGFELKLEDEGDPNSTHCEFYLISKATGNRYSVEAKSRQPNKMHLDVGTQLYKALSKAANYPRVVFIDLNVPQAMATEESLLGKVMPAITSREPKMVMEDGQPAPPAFVYVTNHPFHHDLDGTGSALGAVVVGFKIPDFGMNAPPMTLPDAYKAKQKHIDLFTLMDAFRNYHIPSTFDGEIPEFSFGEAERRWTIGERHQLDHESCPGTLVQGVVVENERCAYLNYAMDDGRNIMVTADLSDAELSAYRQHPETFFGEYRKVGKNTNDPLALFEFIYESYKKTPHEKLLTWMAGAPDIEKLKALPDEELRLVFAERNVVSVMQKTGKPRPAPPPPEGPKANAA